MPKCILRPMWLCKQWIWSIELSTITPTSCSIAILEEEMCPTFQQGFSPARCHWSVFLMLLVYKSTTFPYIKCGFRKATEAWEEVRERRMEVSWCQSDHVFPTSSRRRAVKPNGEEKMSQERLMCLCHVCYEQSSHLVVTLWTVTAGERDQEIERGSEWRVGCG